MIISCFESLIDLTDVVPLNNVLSGFFDGFPGLLSCFFFLVLCISVLYSMAGDWDDGYRLTPAITGVITVVCLGCVFGTTLAMLEAMVVACALLWMLIQGVKILRIRKD